MASPTTRATARTLLAAYHATRLAAGAAAVYVVAAAAIAAWHASAAQSYEFELRAVLALATSAIGITLLAYLIPLLDPHAPSEIRPRRPPPVGDIADRTFDPLQPTPVAVPVAKPLTAQAQLRREAQQIVLDTITTLIPLARAYNPAFNPERTWSPKVTFDWRKSRFRSRGGAGGLRGRYSGGGISLAMNRHVPITGHGGSRFLEYRHYHNDPEIGGFLSDDWKDGLRALTAHEFAHVVQMILTKYLPADQAKPYQKAHGDGFKDIYRLFRRTVINPHLSNPRLYDR